MRDVFFISLYRAIGDMDFYVNDPDKSQPGCLDKRRKKRAMFGQYFKHKHCMSKRLSL